VNSSGCGKADAQTGVSTAEVDVGGSARSYVFSVPADYDASRPYPLVFAWHGLGGSGTLARAYFRVEQQSKGGALFVYPDAATDEWDLGAEGIDVQFFDALVEKLGQSHCIDQNRIFSTGHSFGGFMTERLGCSRGAILRGIAPVAGGPPFGGSTNCADGVAAWITHGSNDETVDFETGEAGRDLWLATNGCGSTTASTAPEGCVAYEACEQPLHWCVHDQGHDWPTFAPAAIWSFFASL
jgi:poly(3-hydroxybutyrate) depolymerase